MLNCDMTQPFWKGNWRLRVYSTGCPTSFQYSGWLCCTLIKDTVHPSIKRQRLQRLIHWFKQNVATPHRCFQWVQPIRPVSNWAELRPNWCNVKTHCDNGPFHYSCVEMKSQANTGGTNESCDGSVPFGVAEPCHWDNKHWSSSDFIWPEWERAFIICVNEIYTYS